MSAHNDAARWGRLDLALLNVAPNYRQDFGQRHATWSRDVQLADSDITAMHIEESGQVAHASVALSWYRTSEMTLFQTVLQQRWRKHESGFLLEDETVVAGSPELLNVQASPGAGLEAPSDPSAGTARAK